MLSIFRMDMHRLLRSKIFYVSIGLLLAMATGLILGEVATTPAELLGATTAGGLGGGEGDDFMGAALGTGVIFILVGITLTIFVCTDYSSGFAKNIFTTHSNPCDYIFGKLLSMSSTSGLLMVIYTILVFVALAITGNSLALEGGVMGLVAYLWLKWLVSCAIIALVLLVNLSTRNSAVGIILSFIVATGGLTMGISMLAAMLGISWLNPIFSFTISGISSSIGMVFAAGTFFKVLFTCTAWMLLCVEGCRKLLKTRDV